MKKISEKLEFLMLLSKTESVISRKLQSQGLGFADVMVLHAITQAPDGKARGIDLAQEVGLTASGVTRLLIPLEKLGIIKRISNERDARSSYISLTNSGKVMLNDATKLLEEKCDDLIPKGNTTAMHEAVQLFKALAN